MPQARSSRCDSRAPLLLLQAAPAPSHHNILYGIDKLVKTVDQLGYANRRLKRDNQVLRAQIAQLQNAVASLSADRGIGSSDSVCATLFSACNPGVPGCPQPRYEAAAPSPLPFTPPTEEISISFVSISSDDSSSPRSQASLPLARATPGPPSPLTLSLPSPPSHSQQAESLPSLPLPPPPPPPGPPVPTAPSSTPRSSSSSFPLLRSPTLHQAPSTAAQGPEPEQHVICGQPAEIFARFGALPQLLARADSLSPEEDLDARALVLELQELTIALTDAAADMVELGQLRPAEEEAYVALLHHEFSKLISPAVHDR